MGDDAAKTSRLRDGIEEPHSALDELAHEVIGAALEVHRELGPGYLESVYEEALAVELRQRGVPYVRQLPFRIRYKNHHVGEGCLDLLVDNALVVELKTVETLLPIHTAQALSYLKALELNLALLINFKVPVLRNGIKRIVRSR